MRVERATRKTALFRASASGGVLREAQYQREAAFTMAEILLSLTIIGVVAAVTLPSLTGNINERTWNTQRKALYARMSQAVALMPALNGYGVGATEAETTENATEVFITNGLSKVLKINNICDSGHLSDCGIPSKINTMDTANPTITPFPTTFSELNSEAVSVADWVDGAVGLVSGYTHVDTKTAAFETQNGESIAVFYNPSCTGKFDKFQYNGEFYSQKHLCVNFIYDLNGTKGPNTVGKDIGFMSVLGAIDSSVVAPVLLPTDTQAENYTAVLAVCRAADSESRIPNLEEMVSMFVNKKLWGPVAQSYASAERTLRGNGYYVSMKNGHISGTGLNDSARTRCVKR